MESNTQEVHAEMERVRRTFAEHVESMTTADLSMASNGTSWTNRQLLFHMLFGYLIVRTLLPMTKCIGHLPPPASRPFAALLNLMTAPFEWINYVGSVMGGTIFTPKYMQRRLNRVTLAIERDLDKQTPKSLARGMHYPVKWDPYFRAYMTLADLYRYPTKHFDHHDRQLSR